ncbi:MarR family transcriptional regulator [Microbacterium sp. Au-Mic1]|uniref:GbsR/MarR family transcriptional regulator n=1 Tax=Microbacterium sp. Au-Mic1 TaxID=2906457 RepID=UPI001E621D06|nr:MarR family transcriptional regulator [Microbacterium sp. Au-Mic1]MCE4026034.1 MarR family transcriptional regulator [Microbacterium sp. Au-Mic1]
MASIEDRVAYADRVAGVWATRYRIAPITGRIAGYLYVCEPGPPTIDELATTLQASRTAIVNGVQALESRGLVRRTRAAGERADRIAIVFDEARGFDAAPYREAAVIAEEGLALLASESVEQRALLERTASLNAFLAERLPVLLDEWRRAEARR